MLRDARIHLVCPLFVSVDARFRGPQPDLQLRLGKSCFTKPKFWSANENFCSRNQISWSMSRWRMGNRLGAEGFRCPSRATPQLRTRLVQDLLRPLSGYTAKTRPRRRVVRAAVRGRECGRVLAAGAGRWQVAREFWAREFPEPAWLHREVVS